MKRTRKDFCTCPECGEAFLRFRLNVVQRTCGERKCIEADQRRRKKARTRPSLLEEMTDAERETNAQLHDYRRTRGELGFLRQF